jgi:hypothetical protein
MKLGFRVQNLTFGIHALGSGLRAYDVEIRGGGFNFRV